MIEMISGPLISIPNSTVRTNAQVEKGKVSLDCPSSNDLRLI